MFFKEGTVTRTAFHNPHGTRNPNILIENTTRVNVAQYLTLDLESANAIYLGVGADIPGYRAHIVSASLE